MRTFRELVTSDHRPFRTEIPHYHLLNWEFNRIYLLDNILYILWFQYFRINKRIWIYIPNNLRITATLKSAYLLSSCGSAGIDSNLLLNEHVYASLIVLLLVNKSTALTKSQVEVIELNRSLSSHTSWSCLLNDSFRQTEDDNYAAGKKTWMSQSICGAWELAGPQVLLAKAHRSV
jgi:hypothetical protein